MVIIMNDDLEQKRLEMLEYYNQLSPSDKDKFEKQFSDIFVKEVAKEIESCVQHGEVNIKDGVVTYGN